MKRYKIYRNLHKQNFSIQGFLEDKKGYRVIDYGCSIILYDVIFKVLESGRQKVLNEKRKNVHAFIMPLKYEKINLPHQLIEKNYNLKMLREIYYDPYKYKSFIYKDNGKQILKAKKVLLFNNKAYKIN